MSATADAARHEALEELQLLREEKQCLPEPEILHRRRSIGVKLKRLAPGQSCSLGLIRDSTGNLLSDPANKAGALKHHWEAVLDKRYGDPSALVGCLGNMPIEELPGGMGPPRASHVRRALRISPNTTPGPDGIPFACWRAMGEDAVLVLTEAMQDLMSPGVRNRLISEFGNGISHTWNEGLLVLLPNKPAGEDPFTENALTLREPAPCVLLTLVIGSSLTRFGSPWNLPLGSGWDTISWVSSRDVP